MDEATWARHANPWSVWTRVAILPLMALAVWSRVWIGWWALLPVALLVVWTWLNPRAFPPPRSFESWAAKGVLGERLWIARREGAPLPERHRRLPLVLNGVSAAGLVPLVYGLVVLDAWATLFGLSVTMVGKLWFVDRMVWLYEDVRGGGQGQR
ncbi:MAG: hypothetical protein IRZ13_06400 [Acetobacteraceae bacterium]|nr:hypothetical protein [Acetobacteraceae bacterium]